jgi:hypothetical protein
MNRNEERGLKMREACSACCSDIAAAHAAAIISARDEVVSTEMLTTFILVNISSSKQTTRQNGPRPSSNLHWPSIGCLLY